MQNEHILNEIKQNRNQDEIDLPIIYFLGALGGDFWSKFLIQDFHEHGINIDAIEQYQDLSSPMANCIVNVENGTRSILSFTK